MTISQSDGETVREMELEVLLSFLELSEKYWGIESNYH